MKSFTLLLLMMLLVLPAAAQETPQSFPNYVTGQPKASSPCTSSDLFPVIEGGVTHQVTGDVVCSSTIGPLTSHLATMASTGFSSFTTNPGGAGYSIKDSAAGIVIGGPDQGSDALNAACKAAPTPPFTISARIIVNTNAGESSDSGGGLAWRDAATDKWETYYLLAFPTIGQAAAAVYDIPFTNSSTVISGSMSQGHAFISTQSIWQQFQDDGTRIYENVSQDGINYVTVATTLKSAGYLGTNGYNQICFFASGHGAFIKVTMQQYLESAGAVIP